MGVPLSLTVWHLAHNILLQIIRYFKQTRGLVFYWILLVTVGLFVWKLCGVGCGRRWRTRHVHDLWRSLQGRWKMRCRSWERRQLATMQLTPVACLTHRQYSLIHHRCVDIPQVGSTPSVSRQVALSLTFSLVKKFVGSVTSLQIINSLTVRLSSVRRLHSVIILW